LNDNNDELAWYTQLSGGQYSAKLEYKATMDSGDGNLLWWFKKLWGIKGPPKSMIFFWLVLKEKVLTWDHLQQRGQQRLGLCYLCKGSEETNVHLFLECSFARQVWMEVGNQLGVHNLWSKDNLQDCFKEFFSDV
jgi:hypothetical protein